MNILLATGGSGGHIFPALQTALVLRKRGHAVTFAGVLGSHASRIRHEGFDVHLLYAQGLSAKSPAGIYAFTKNMLSATKEAKALVRRLKPDKVLGFGGYGSFPVMAAALMCRVPCYLHEQNVMPGKANAYLGAWVKQVAVSFAPTMNRFGRKAVWTGCPCHAQAADRSREEILKSLGLSVDLKIIVLLGGSQGSQFLNDVFFQAMGRMLKQGQVGVIHVSGPKEYETYRARYALVAGPAIVMPFYSPIEDIYAVADVIVSRAGAATVTELGRHGVPAVLVPYPYAHAHQQHNAQVLEQVRSATVLDQSSLTPQRLQEAIMSWLGQAYQTKEQLRQSNAVVIKANAAEAIAAMLEGS